MVKKINLKNLKSRDFRQGLLVGLTGVLVLVGVFIAGYFTGQWRLKKSQFCFPPKDLPRPLRRVMEENLGPDFLRRWQGRAVLGRVKRIGLTELVLTTKDGERDFRLTFKTRYLKGRSPARKAEVTEGQLVAGLLDREKQTARAVILLR